MKGMERCVQRIKPGKFNDFIALEKKYDAAEAKLGGVPPERRYWMHYGELTGDTNVWEREWESMAAIEAYGEKVWNNPEWQALGYEGRDIFFDGRFELYYSFTLEDFSES